MAVEPSKALLKRSTDTDLMPPPAKRIKRPQKVLDEETYVSGISEIIARDFFPGLLETETQQEYLDALESRDQSWISSAGSRLSHIMTPGRKRGKRGTSVQAPAAGHETPKSYGGDTPMSVMSSVSKFSAQAPRKPVVNTNLSLDAFQATYTSEDNESFYKLLDKQNQKRAEKYSWMWRGNKLPSNRLIKQKEVERKLLQNLGSIEDDGGSKDLMVIRDIAEKPAMPDTWRSRPNNNFMFGPDSVEDSVETIAQKAQDESRAPPKGVIYDNTRILSFSSTTDTDSKISLSPSLLPVRDAIAGQPRWTASESGFEASEAPRINGYAFVDDEPEIQEYDAPQSTIVFAKADATPNPFKIKEQSKREDLHHRMVDRVAKTKRLSSKIGMVGRMDITPIPKFPSSPRVGVANLTPAAQRLWSKVGSAAKPSSPLVPRKKTPSVQRSEQSQMRVGFTPK